MRFVSFLTALVALSSMALGTAGALAGDQSSEPGDLQAMKVAKVDLEAALSYEKMALASARKRNSAKAHHQLVNARGALNDMRDAVEELAPPEWWDHEYAVLHHKEEPWLKFGRNLGELEKLDLEARGEVGGDLVELLEAANERKREMLDFVTEAIKSRCVELVNLRGPITVNGVPQGHSELTVSISCHEGIDELDLSIHNLIWTEADAGADKAKVLEGGKVLEVDAHGAESVTVTAEANPDPASGQTLAGDIIPIAGDSAPPIDETM